MTTSRFNRSEKSSAKTFRGALPPDPQSFWGQKKIGGGALCLAMAATAVVAQDIPVPSGLDVSLHEVLIEADLARFRFLAPQISVDDSGKTFGEVVDDIQFLCDAVALPALRENGWDTGGIVVSLSARMVPFGETAPDVAQFFQPFSIAGDACQWEDF